MNVTAHNYLNRHRFLTKTIAISFPSFRESWNRSMLKQTRSTNTDIRWWKRGGICTGMVCIGSIARRVCNPFARIPIRVAVTNQDCWIDTECGWVSEHSKEPANWSKPDPGPKNPKNPKFDQTGQFDQIWPSGPIPTLFWIPPQKVTFLTMGWHFNDSGVFFINTTPDTHYEIPRYFDVEVQTGKSSQR
jgi:hypothetical protein